ncbi:MAG: ATP-binding cassette domain-containing protein [Burkholderiales bacterium]
MKPLIALHAVGVRFGRVQALAACSLNVAAGERVALIGGNGSGKSTLLRVINGLIQPDSGQVVCEPQARQAMVFQHPHMLRLSTLHNVALGPWLAGVPWAQAKGHAGAALARVGLQQEAQRLASKLSGGQQQRAALARAWALKPDVLLLDEPTASLDPHAKREVEALIGEFAAQGMTLVFASHHLGQVKRLATRVVFLERGRILADLPVAEFFDGSRLPAISAAADLFLKGELA